MKEPKASIRLTADELYTIDNSLQYYEDDEAEANFRIEQYNKRLDSVHKRIAKALNKLGYVYKL